MDLNTKVVQIERIGPAYAKRLKKLGIKEVRDLLFHFPARYEDFTKISPIAKIEVGQSVTIRGRISDIKEKRIPYRRFGIIEAVIGDDSGEIKVLWFNQGYLLQTLDTNKTVLLSGKVTSGKNGTYLSNPIYEIARASAPLIHTARLVAIYPETRGVSSRWLRYIMERLLHLSDKLEDPLPFGLLKEKKFPKIADAIRAIHFPKNLKNAQIAQNRFAFEELFYMQLAALLAKYKILKKNSSIIPTDIKLTKKFVASLPFKLTDSQRRASWQILKDLEKPSPMNRLLEGDVGSGKTIVAALVALNAVKAGYQVAIMAPTEILAEQHYKNFVNLYENNDVVTALYTRARHERISKKISYAPYKLSKEKLKKEIADSFVNVVIGTHALTQEKVRFGNLGFVVIDEQHRFGVAQRAALQKKDETTNIPHFLSMTATPIPRTLALTVYGDLDISLLREMPKGRKKIITKITPPNKRNEAYSFIKKELELGRQAFVIFPLVEESEKLALRAATQEYEKLSQGPFKGFKLGLLHGRMKSHEKESVMREFQDKKIQMLISTSVVEVGIDVANATIMMIDGADRFGLAQLHQFRGRVGRGEHQSYCFLLSESKSASVLKRLRALVKAKDGFELAEYDMAFRGVGDLYGIRQSGIPDLAMASLSNVKLIEEARHAAQNILDEDPTLKKYKILKERVRKMQKIMHFE